MKKWYSMSYIDVLNGLDSDLDMGINYIQVEKYRKAFGDNIISTPKKISIFTIFIKEILFPWSILMIVLLGLSLYTREYISFTIAISIYFFIAGIFVYFKYKEQSSFSAMDVLNSSSVDVLREGLKEKIRIEELVVGDIVFLHSNTYVPADIRLIKEENLKVNELAVTGKDYIVEKFSARLEESEELGLEEMSNMLFKSTMITEGEGIGVVVATGMNTEIGSFMKAQFSKEISKNTLFKRMKSILNKFSIMGIIIGIISTAISLFLKVKTTKILELIMGICWVMIPMAIFIIFLVSIILFLKIQKNKGIEINDLSVLKNIAMMKTLILDKMGILSKEEMNINKVFIDNKLLKLSSNSSFEVEKYYKEQNKDEENTMITISNSNTLERLISTSLLCNDAIYSDESDIKKGDIKEIAMIKFAESNFMYKSEVNGKFPRVNEIPMDGEKKIKTTLNSVDKKFRANSVGFLESILEKSTHILRNGIELEMSKEERDRVKEAALDIAMDGMEVIALAYRNFNYKPSLDENIESNLVFIGLMGIINPIKAEAYSFNEKTMELGLNPIIFTDENKVSAQSFGKEINILKDYSNIYSGIEFKYMAEHEIKKIINSENMFCNLNEDQKVLIAREHKRDKKSIGVIGKKLTDIPHISEADVSVSFGDKVSSILKKISHIYMRKGNINDFFDLIYESKEILSAYEDLNNEAILCCSALVSSMILCFVINQSILMNISRVLYFTLVIIGINGVVIFMQYKSKIFLKKEDKHIKDILKDKQPMTSFLIKGVCIGVLSYLAFLFGTISYNNTVADMMYVFSLGMGLVFSPLNINKFGKVMKGLLSNLLMFFNLINVIFFITLQNSINGVSYTFNDFIGQKYVIVFVLIFLNYLINILFRDNDDNFTEEMYMDYY